MSDANSEFALDANGLSETNGGEKTRDATLRRKSDGKLRSKAWDHFTKLVKEDGTFKKCKCNHCGNLFSCSSRSGTTHLLRHMIYAHGMNCGLQTVPTCARGNSEPIRRMMRQRLDRVALDLSGQPTGNVHNEVSLDILDDLDSEPFLGSEDDYMGEQSKQTSVRFPQQPASKRQSREESWMNELGACLRKLVDITNERLQNGSSITPDYSISAAVRFLDEMEDIPPSSEMYLDAFELLRDGSERECFICLPSVARRRWLQRMLHLCYPSRYSSNS